MERWVENDNHSATTLGDLLHFIKVFDPEGFRREAMEKRDWYMQVIADEPTPKRILRRHRQQEREEALERQKSSSGEPERPNSPGRKRERPRNGPSQPHPQGAAQPGVSSAPTTGRTSE